MILQRVKSLYKIYTRTFWSIFWYSIILVYPAIVNFANPAPLKNELQWISGKVVFAQQKHPNMRLELPDGSMQDFDFHADLSTVFSDLSPFYGASNQELASLQGCRAEIGVVPIRWLIIPHNQRIWEVRSEGFTLPYSKLINIYQKQVKEDIAFNGVIYFLLFSFAIITFLWERRFKWASQPADILKKSDTPEVLSGQAETVSMLGWLLLTTWVVSFILCSFKSAKLAIILGGAIGIILVPAGLFCLCNASSLRRKASQNSLSSNTCLTDEEVSNVSNYK